MKTKLLAVAISLLALACVAAPTTANLLWNYQANAITPNMGWAIVSSNAPVSAQNWPVVGVFYASNYGSFNVVTNYPDPNNPTNALVTTNYVGSTNFFASVPLPDGPSFYSAFTFIGSPPPANNFALFANFIQTNRPLPMIIRTP